MNVYYLSNFNNYYNRQLKKYNTRNIEDFNEFIVYSETGKNFNPNDNVNTSLTVNIEDNIDIDYILISEENNIINSKWYVIEKTRNRKGQWFLNLRRDLLADYFEEIKTSPIFFEKGWLNVNNPLIFNSENLTVNQIKQKEILLSDKTNTPWIVGYLAPNYASAEGADPDNITSTYYVENTIYPELSWIKYHIMHTIYTGGKNQTLITRLRNIPDGRIFDIKQSGSFTQSTDNPNTTGLPYIPSASTNFFSNSPANDTSAINEFIYDYYNAEKFTSDLTNAGFTNTAPYIEDISDLLKYNKMKIKNSDYIEGSEETNGPEYFYLNIVPQYTSVKKTYLTVASAEYNRAKALIQSIYNNGNYSNLFEFRTYSANGNTFAIEFTVMEYKIGLSTSGPSVGVNMSIVDLQGKELRQLNDAPYVMFAAPYNNVKYINASGQEKEHNGLAAVNLASEIIRRFSGGYSYDLQLLPYCPIPDLININGIFDMTGLQNKCFSTIFAGTNEVGFFVFPETASFSNYIYLDEPINLPNDNMEAKLDIETKFCRLMSPNYSGAFEFTPLKNGGVSYFEVNCTYKPYQPFIHINPYFNSGYLYGGDFDDNRGLICGGDFSLPQTSDAWIAYQSQNKSYKESFNREIENMETTNAIQRQREVVSATLGAVNAGLTGAAGGMIVSGNPAGAAAGLATGALSAIGGAMDIKLSDRLRAEGIDFSKDMFGYQLQNIQAMPNTLNRTSSFDTNNKLFPVLEFYECTPTERESLKNKIKYNGMTIMTIGKLEDYTDFKNRYIKGQLIRLVDENDNSVAEFHESVEIASELMKGVYI